MKKLFAVIAAMLLVTGCSSKGESPEVVSTAEAIVTVLTPSDITQELNTLDRTVVLSDIYEKEGTKRFNLVHRYGKKFTFMLTNVYTEEGDGLGRIGTLQALNGYCFDEDEYEVSGMQFTMQDSKTLVTDLLTATNVSTLTSDYAASKKALDPSSESSPSTELTWDYVQNALNTGDTADITYVISDVYEDNGNKCFDTDMVYKDEFSMCIKNIYETDGKYLGSRYIMKARGNYTFEDMSSVTYFGEIESYSDTEVVSTLQTLEGMVSLEKDKQLIERQIADIKSMNSFEDSYNQMMEEVTNMDVALSESGAKEILTVFSDDIYYIHVINADGMVACQTTDTELMEVTPSSDNTLEVKPLKNGDGKITISDTNGNSCVVTVFVRM